MKVWCSFETKSGSRSGCGIAGGENKVVEMAQDEASPAALRL
jgi:hypothetical protein